MGKALDKGVLGGAGDSLGLGKALDRGVLGGSMALQIN